MPYLGRATLRDVIVMRRTNGPPRRMAAVLESIFTANRGLPEPDLDDDSGGMNPSASYVAGVAWLGAQLADALGEAHRRGILHLDLKPTNVLLTKRGVPKLIDFNLAADLRNDARRLGGTWNYMSPEQVRCTMDGAGSTPIDHRSDIFSLGVVLHELLTGELPDRPERNRVAHSPDSSASAPKSAAAAGRHAHDRRLLRIVQRCLAPDPRDRYQDCEELRRALEHELSPTRRAERWLRRHPRLAAASCLAAVVLVLLVGSYFATRAPYWQRQFESGRKAFEHSQYDAAIGHLNIVIKESPSHAAAYYLRGEAYANLGKYAVATEDLVDGCRLAPDAAKMEFIGYCYNKRRSHTEATYWYDLARQAGRNSVSLYNNQGYSLVQLGQTEAALPWLNRALELDGRCQTALVNRSQAYLNLAMQQRRFPAEAIPDVQLALKLGPPSGQLYHLAAMIFARGARYDNVWHDSALACVGHAIEYGESLRSLEKNPGLADLLHAWQKTNPAKVAGGKGPYEATRLIDPRHPAGASSLTVVEPRAASQSGRTLARR